MSFGRGPEIDDGESGGRGEGDAAGDESDIADAAGGFETVVGLVDVGALGGGASARRQTGGRTKLVFRLGGEPIHVIPRILGAQPEANVDAGSDSGDGASDNDGDPGGFLASDWVGCGGVGGLELRQGAGFAGGGG